MDGIVREDEEHGQMASITTQRESRTSGIVGHQIKVGVLIM